MTRTNSKRSSRSQLGFSMYSHQPAVETLEGRLLLATYWMDDSVWSNGTTQTPSDYNSGSQSAPFATLQKAINVANPGDIINVKQGIYRQSAWANSSADGGTSSLHVTIQKDPVAPAGSAVFKGSELANSGWIQPEPTTKPNVWRLANWPAAISSSAKATNADGSPNWSANAQQLFVGGASYKQIGGPPLALYGTVAGIDVFPQASENWYAGCPVGDKYASMRETPGSFYYESIVGHPNEGRLYLHLAAGDSISEDKEVAVRGRILNVNYTAQYIDVKNLTFEQNNSTALYTMPTAQAVTITDGGTIQGSIIRNNDFGGLKLYGNTITATADPGNQIYSNGDLGIQANKSFKIWNNTIRDNNTRGFEVLWHAGGIKGADVNGSVCWNTIRDNNGPGCWVDVDPSSNPMTITKNLFTGNRGNNGTIMIEISRNTLIANNLIYENSNACGAIYLSNAENTRVYNNTIVRHTPGNGNGAIFLYNKDRGSEYPVLKDNYVRNNIIAETLDPSGGFGQEMKVALESSPVAPTNNNISYNLYWSTNTPIFTYKPLSGPTVNAYSLTSWQNNTPFDAYNQSVWGDPLFMSSANDDFRAQAGGAGVNRGMTLGEVTTDYLQVARPQGGIYDMGAYER